MRWTKWTKTEDKLLREQHGRGIVALCGLFPSRPYHGIKARARKLGLSIPRKTQRTGEYRWRGRLKVPTNVSPIVRLFFTEMNKQRTLITEVAQRAGISVSTISDWRYTRAPRIDTLEAAFNVLDLQLTVKPRDYSDIHQMPTEIGRNSALTKIQTENAAL